MDEQLAVKLPEEADGSAPAATPPNPPVRHPRLPSRGNNGALNWLRLLSLDV